MPKKLEYEDVVRIFKEKGLCLLDNKYVNSKTKMKCKNNNINFIEMPFWKIFTNEEKDTYKKNN